MHDPVPSGRSLRPSDELSECAGMLHDAMSCCGARVRLEILAHLICVPMSGKQLATALLLDHTLVSKYLKVLRLGGFVQMRKCKGTHIFSLSAVVGILPREGVVELQLPARGGLSVTITLPRHLLVRLHPEVSVPAANSLKLAIA